MDLKRGSWGPIVLCCSLSWGHAQLSETHFLERSAYHLLIKDFRGAVDNATVACNYYPHSETCKLALIRMLASDGQWIKALEHLCQYKLYEDVKTHFSLIEHVAWSALLHHRASSDMHDVAAMVSAAATNDARAIALLANALNASNILLRVQGIRLCERYPDRMLQMRLLELLEKERNSFVRTELLNMAHKIRHPKVQKVLQSLLQSSGTSIEEMGLAIRALSEHYESIRAQDLQYLLKHPKMGLRGLGLELIYRLQQEEQYAHILDMLEDRSGQIRVQALRIMALLDHSELYSERALGLLRQRADDPYPYTAILAHWLLLTRGQEASGEVLQVILVESCT